MRAVSPFFGSRNEGNVQENVPQEIEITSSLTGITYVISDCVRILNPVQVSAYIRHGAKLIDLIIGDENKLVFIFDKKSTAYLYELWLIRELR
jgi:hypothetical protein